MAVLGEIDGLDVITASIAGFDAHMRESIGGVDGQLLPGLFAAGGKVPAYLSDNCVRN
jgi:hypothetical protein